jgi:uncharacterized protein
MYRKALKDLEDWKQRSGRKPLIIRGARQVGKTWMVREFARQNFDTLLEINFDKTPEKSSLFKEGDLSRCLQMLALDADLEIIPGKTLVFFDEIQAAPELFPLLRYFYEDQPDIHIIAAGSLLEFLLNDHAFSMPVGRVEYLHLGPMDFDEFLLGLAQDRLAGFLANFSIHDQIPESIHENLLYYVKLFWIIGGMPAAVDAYTSGGITNTTREHENILQTYEDDFGKYRKRIYPQRLRKIFSRLPVIIGKKLKYVNLVPGEKARDLADSLYLLELARIYYPVKHSSGNGIPLGAEAKASDFKPLFLDSGLVSTSLGLSLPSLQMVDDLLMVNNGAIAEQFIGQHLLYRQERYKKPMLYYWNREKKSSQAEVDYLVSVGDKVVPVEVKAGKGGSLKSLHVFVAEKKVETAFRFCAQPPSCGKFETAISGKDKVQFNLISLPLYLAGQVNRLLIEALEG